MLQTAKEIEGEAIIISGYRNQDLFLKEELESAGTLFIATEDGSVGTKGNVVDAIRENQIEADMMFACGPKPMLRALKIMHWKKESLVGFPWKRRWHVELEPVLPVYVSLRRGFSFSCTQQTNL